ncbi:MAG: SurA N-terminal domain-containing protein [bacterium]|nr:SurA N-terminal domain-containing protein [bacterium]
MAKRALKQTKKTVVKRPAKTAKTPHQTKAQSPIPAFLQTLSLGLNKRAKGAQDFVRSYKPTKLTYLAIIILGLAILVSTKKSLFLAATVNGSPITNYELLTRMNQQYRDKMLTQMVNEKIIMEEAKKKGVTVSDAELNNKVSEVEKKVGGAQALDSLLTQQGETRVSLISQLKVELIAEKLYDKDATVSAEEVNQFIEANKDQLQATDSAGQQKEATDALKQQKLGKVFSDKFQQLKSQAKIQIF